MAYDKDRLFEKIYFLWKGEGEKRNQSIEWYCERYGANIEEFRKWLQGIVYTSVHNTNDFKFPDFVKINYVFPVKEQMLGYAHCPQLCNIFRITKPTCEEYERIKHGSVIGPDNYSILIPEDVTIAEAKKHFNYEMSLFRSIERNLENTKLFGLKKINPVKTKSKASV